MGVLQAPGKNSKIVENALKIHNKSKFPWTIYNFVSHMFLQGFVNKMDVCYAVDRIKKAWCLKTHFFSTQFVFLPNYFFYK
jgi:hypothetical protein